MEIPKIEMKTTDNFRPPQNPTSPPTGEPKGGVLVDWFMTALIILITAAIIATYFIQFDLTAGLNVKKVTVNTLWFAVGTFSIGALAKRVFRRKGEKTQAYEMAEAEANKAIKALNESKYANRASEYAEQKTRETIERFRKHTLVTVGIDYQEYQNAYLGKGVKTLLFSFLRGEVSFLQYRAIWRCNRVKIKAYDPNFITSYDAEVNEGQTASDMYNVKKANRNNDLTSAFFTICSAFGIGFMFSDVLLNFSAETLFEAIIKIVMIGINIGLKASFGWNLSVMETKRNNLRASEARACMAWAESTPVKTENLHLNAKKEEV